MYYVPIKKYKSDKVLGEDEDMDLEDLMATKVPKEDMKIIESMPVKSLITKPNSEYGLSVGGPSIIFTLQELLVPT